MISIRDDNLVFRFPDVHEDAVLSINFQRTLRIPDDDTVHFLPPGLGSFPLRNIDDFAGTVPATWREHGGVMLPMFQSEAMWICFGWQSDYPFLVKIAAGGINAVTGETWNDAVTPDPQNYVVDRRTALARRLLREEGRDPPVRGHAPGLGVHRRGADHRQGRHRRPADRSSIR